MVKSLYQSLDVLLDALRGFVFPPAPVPVRVPVRR